MGSLGGISGIGSISGLTIDPFANAILSTQPDDLIAYWPLNETQGSIAHNLQGDASRDGTYSNISLANDSLGGWPVPLFNGTDGFVNIYSSSLNSAFNGSEGTMMIWAKVFDSSVWPALQIYRTMSIFVDAQNDVFTPMKEGIANTLLAIYEAGNVIKSIPAAPFTQLRWLHLTTTWSASADEMKMYVEGVQQGATQTGLGIWSNGPLNPNWCVIGDFNTSSVQPWYGWLAHAALWSVALPPSKILNIGKRFDFT